MWVNNIPSILAFDAVLNQYYINKKRIGQPYQTGSTHFWKSSQNDEHGNFLPMKLKKDNTEFRILEISVGNKNRQYENSKISMHIDPKRLNQSAKYLSDLLSPKKIKISLNDKNRSNLNLWPRMKPSFKLDNLQITEDQLYQLQEESYSFWMSETLSINNSKHQKVNYQQIRELFNEYGYPEIGKNIVPYEKAIKGLETNKFEEIYYKYWYTVFLESYAESVDLGTAMFLTNHSYSSEFLLKSSNWLRWIYNELRLIELKTITQIETEEKDYHDLSHSLNTIISAQNYWMKKNVKFHLSNEENEILEYFLNSISSFISIGKIQYNLQLEEVYISSEIIKMIDIFSILTKNRTLFNLVFDLGIDRDDIFERYIDLKFIDISTLQLKKIKKTKLDLNILKLLLKDIIENLIKHSQWGKPDCKIQCQEINGEICLTILNTSWPTKEKLYQMKNNSFPLKHNGWKTILKMIKTHHWKYELPEFIEDKKYGDYFWIKIII